MTEEAAAIERLRAEALARLRSGLVWEWGDREQRGVLAYDAATDTFVERVFDQLVLGDDDPIETLRHTADAALSRLAPWPESAGGWESVVRRLAPPRRAPTSGGPPAPDVDLGRLVFAGTLDGTRWEARAERNDGGLLIEGRQVVWPKLHVRVTTPAAEHRWRLPVPDWLAWRERGPDAVREAIERRLARRLAEARLLDFSGSHPIPGGGAWTARHADRYEDDGVGFDIVATLPDGREVALHHQLAPPDASRPEASWVAARSRLAKWVRKQTSR